MLRIPLEIRHGHAPRPAALLVAALLAIATLAGCDQSTRLAGVTHVEAWQADVPARFTFPPIGLEEFVLERKQAGRVELVIHIGADRSEEHTSELQSRENLVCRLLLEKKKNKTK